MCDFDYHFDDQGNAAEFFDSELAMEQVESEDWDNPYDGGFYYKGDESPLEGLTTLERPHIDASGSVSAMPLYNWE